MVRLLLPRSSVDLPRVGAALWQTVPHHGSMINKISLVAHAVLLHERMDFSFFERFRLVKCDIDDDTAEIHLSADCNRPVRYMSF